MNAPDQLDELMACRIDSERKAVEPCSVVIFGASGDLTARILIPALIPALGHLRSAERF